MKSMVWPTVQNGGTAMNCGLHPPPGALLGVVEGALERDALEGRQLVENLGLLGLVEALEDADRVVGVEVADALGDGLRLELLEDLLADGVVDLRQRREVEIRSEELDQARPFLGCQGLEQVAEVGLVLVAQQFPQALGVRRPRSPPRRFRRREG